jgi:hypothetical protein
MCVVGFYFGSCRIDNRRHGLVEDSKTVAPAPAAREFI